MTCTRGCCATDRDHWRSVSIADSATPSRHRTSDRVPTPEQQQHEDMAAYKRLKAEGHEPQAINGARALETLATSPEQINREKMVPTPQAKNRG